MSSRGKGVGAALLAALFGAAYYIPFKALGAEVSRPAAVLALVLCAAVLNSATAIGRRGRPSRAVSVRLTLVAAVILGILSVAGNLGVALALAVQEPAVTSVIVHIQILFVVAAEWWLLDHQITVRFVIGAALTVVGFVVMQLGGGAEGASVAGVLWALLAAFSFAMMHVYTRAVIDRISAVAVNALRLWLAAAAMLAFPGVVGELLGLGWWGWGLAAAAAFAGPFLSRLFLMASVRFIPASQVSLLGMTNPLFAFVLGFAAFAALPTGYETVGGAIILIGVVLPLAQRIRR
jgi:drug/metabolite transporter (DMT)-like permease